jgi:hypothetical protein
VAPILAIDANGANVRTARNAASFFVIATLLFGAQVTAQEASAKRGAVKGIVSLKSGTLEHATPEGIALELKPLTNGSAPTTVIKLSSFSSNCSYSTQAPQTDSSTFWKAWKARSLWV